MKGILTFLRSMLHAYNSILELSSLPNALIIIECFALFIRKRNVNCMFNIACTILYKMLLINQTMSVFIFNKNSIIND